MVPLAVVAGFAPPGLVGPAAKNELYPNANGERISLASLPLSEKKKDRQCLFPPVHD